MRNITPKSILVVEDDPAVAQALSLLLSCLRHQVETVGDAERAIARYDDGRRFDLVITDFAMPGIDGLELARLIKERTPQKPVVLVTGARSLFIRVHPNRSVVELRPTEPFPLT